MPFVVGTDEAGYGPNLGPLVITATTWEIPSGIQPADMWRSFSSVLTDRWERGDDRLHVADSKSVYSSGKSIRNLERGVLATLGSLGPVPRCVVDLGCLLAGEEFRQHHIDLCLGSVPELELPISTDRDENKLASKRLMQLFDDSGIRLLKVESQILFAPDFNAAVTKVNSKGKVLSARTMQLVVNSVDSPWRSGKSGMGRLRQAWRQKSIRRTYQQRIRGCVRISTGRV